jgi:hypothetical protein
MPSLVQVPCGLSKKNAAAMPPMTMAAPMLFQNEAANFQELASSTQGFRSRANEVADHIFYSDGMFAFIFEPIARAAGTMRLFLLELSDTSLVSPREQNTS